MSALPDARRIEVEALYRLFDDEALAALQRAFRADLGVIQQRGGPLADVPFIQLRLEILAAEQRRRAANQEGSRG